jgi:hypothetical protein
MDSKRLWGIIILIQLIAMVHADYEIRQAEAHAYLSKIQVVDASPNILDQRGNVPVESSGPNRTRILIRSSLFGLIVSLSICLALCFQKKAFA